MVAELSMSLTRQARILRLKLSMTACNIDSDAGRQPDHRGVHLPVLVLAGRSETFLGLRRMHPSSGAFPPALTDHLVPRAYGREELAKPLRVKR